MAKQRTASRKRFVAPAGQKGKEPPRSTGLRNPMNWLMLLVAVVPLLFSRATMDPVLAIRYAVLSGAVLLFVSCFYLFKKTPSLATHPPLIQILFRLLIAYGLWSFVSAVFALNGSVALYEIARFFLNVILLYLITDAAAKDADGLLKICKAVTIASLIQSAVGILQAYGIAFSTLPGSEKPYGLMAHRTLFGSAQACLLPFTAFALYKGTTFWKWLSSFALSGIVLSVMVSQSRSAWLATAVFGLTAFVLLLVFSKQNRRRLTLLFFTGAAAGALAMAAFLFTGKEGPLSKSIKDRVLRLTQMASDPNTLSTGRLALWAKSAKLFQQHPLTGVGSGNWNLAIPPYRDEEGAWAYGQQVPSWPHNVYLQVACETGLPGMLLFLCTVVLLTYTGFKNISDSTPKDLRMLNVLMLAGLAAFAADACFSFPTERIEHCLYLVLMAGIVLGTFVRGTIPQKENGRPLKRWVAITFFLLASFNLLMGISKYQFERHTALAKQYREEGRWTELLAEAEEGKSAVVTLDPNGEPLEMLTAAAYVQLKNYDKALTEIQRAVRLHPNSARAWTTMGVVYANQRDYPKAIESYKKALALTPHYDLALRNLAGVYFIVGDYAACIKTAEFVSINNKASVKELLDEAQKRVNAKQ